MVKIQIDLTKQENKNLELYKINNDLKDKRLAIKKILGDLQ